MLRSFAGDVGLRDDAGTASAFVDNRTRRIWCFSIVATTSSRGVDARTVTTGCDMASDAVCPIGFLPLRRCDRRCRDWSHDTDRADAPIEDRDFAAVLLDHEFCNLIESCFRRAARRIRRHDIARHPRHGNFSLLTFLITVPGVHATAVPRP